MIEIKLSQWAKEKGYTYRGAFNIYKRGCIPYAYKTESGAIRIRVCSPEEEKSEYTVVYARVSSSENRTNLENQAERVSNFCNAKGWIIDEVIKECASGLNDCRPKLQKILEEGKATRIVFEHKDRLTRFGYAYIETLFKGELVPINSVNTGTEDIMQDFVSLVTSFCARIYGRRRSKRATQKLINDLNNETS